MIAVAALLFLLLAVKHGGGSTRALVNIYINTNGMPTILGISLGRGAVRDVTFRALRWAHVPVRVMVPSPSTPPGYRSAGWVNDTNFSQTITAVIRSGLVLSNIPSGPSPYE